MSSISLAVFCPLYILLIDSWSLLFLMLVDDGVSVYFFLLACDGAMCRSGGSSIN